MARIPRLESLSPRARLVVGVVLGLGVAGLMALFRGGDALTGLEHAVVDFRTRVFASDRGPDPRIVLAEVSDSDVRDLRAASTWPWPLHFNAQAIDTLTRAGARVVMVDVYHLDAGAGPEDVGQDPADEVVALNFGPSMDEGDALQAAFAQHQRVVIGYQLASGGEYERPARVEAAVPKLVPPDVLLEAGAGIARPHARIPVRRASAGATTLGFGNFPPDEDGVARRAAVYGTWGSRDGVSLPLAAAALATEGPKELRPRSVRLGGARQPLMEDGTFLVNFRGPPGTYPHVYPADLVTWGDDPSQPLPPEAATLKDKIVVWGVWMAGQEDNIATPFKTMHGPEWQATVLDNLLNGDGRVYAEEWLNLAVLFGICLVLGLAGMTLRMRWAGVVAVATLAVGVGIAFWLFRRGTSVDVVVPVLGAILAWISTAGFRLLTEGRRNKWLEGTFGLYLAPSVIKVLKDDPTRLALGGRRREITVLFSDIRGFTKFSEKLPPEQLTALLNRYLSLHAGAVMAEGGTVDKFIGDAVMAFFGDPLDAPDHAVQGCRTAIAAMAIPPTLDEYCRELGIPGIEIGVGLNSGFAVVGNMGSNERFAYTAMGDTVNLSSRLESATKAFGARILIGPLTYEQAKEHIVSRPVADLVVKGKAQAVAVHELLAMRKNADPGAVALADAFARAQERAKAGDLDGANAALDECERLRAGDGLSAWFRGVLDRIRSGAEPAPWSGRVVLESK